MLGVQTDIGKFELLGDDDTEDNLLDPMPVPQAVTTSYDAAGLAKAVECISKANNYAFLLPAFFKLPRGIPFKLDDYKPFTVLYDKMLPDRSLLKTGRQCSKSTNIAHSGVLRAACIPNFKQLYVTPLYEQCCRFSNEYVRPAITMSTLYQSIVDSDCEQRVLQRRFKNNSTLFFTFCFRDVDRARGIPADALSVDEIQDIEFDFLPVLNETMSASNWKITQMAGTPKTTDNTISQQWNMSSQGEWVIPCKACGKENTSCVSEDLLAMIGPTGLICAKCGREIDTDNGFWRHRFPDRELSFRGLHIPQPVLKLHCRNKRAWRLLLEKRDKWKKSLFYNEVLGEDCDVGAKLIGLEQIKKASTLPVRNVMMEAADYFSKQSYAIRVLGIDWGGRGLSEDSFTAMVVMGLKADGTIEVVFGERVPSSVEDSAEIDLACNLHQLFRCDTIGHDFRGVGTAKDTMLVARGHRTITPWSNEGCNTKYFIRTQRTTTNRTYVSVNRSMAVTLLAHEFSDCKIRLPKWEDNSQNNVWLDFNSWYENFISRPDGANIYRIERSAGTPDDIGMATIYACLTAWRRLNAWPSFAKSLTSSGVIDDKVPASRGQSVDSE